MGAAFGALLRRVGIDSRHVKYVGGALGDGNRVQILRDAWPLASENL